MAKMNERVKEIFQKQQNVVLATASKEGIPNVVVLGAKKIIDDETILISDQYFDKTLANMKENPRAAVTVWEKTEGYQIKGTVTVETSGPRFDETARWIEDLGKKFNIPLKSKGAVILKITDIYTISPGSNAGQKIA
ncbi:MAG: pyridoxamine 5'-phosphate oxidase family protein [Deltaproteobacteria bacterium]|nr:pyridoxamine 5'-phosphate oxidase family protein [Deltaproteobacteria bacterium]